MTNRAIRIPILMYHKVGADDPFINVTPERFEQQIRLMLRLGYTAITFNEAIERLRSGSPGRGRPFVITFDDGYSCVWNHAVPILERYSLPATVFVVSRAIGQTNAWDHQNSKPVLPLMGRDELLQLHARGWEIGGHTCTHPHLNKLDDNEALREIQQGRIEAEEILGIPQSTFCYPYGDMNLATPRIVSQAGYIGACTTRSGIAGSSKGKGNLFMVPRVKMAHRDGAAGLLYKLKLRPILPTFRRERYAH